MSHQDVVSEVVSRLEGARAELIAELQRVDSALAALRGTLVASNRSPRPPMATLEIGEDLVFTMHPPITSVKAAVLARMETEQDIWTAATITATLEKTEGLPSVQNLGNAVRTALVTLAKEGAITRVERGQYAATKWFDGGTRSDSIVIEEVPS